MPSDTSGRVNTATAVIHQNHAPCGSTLPSAMLMGVTVTAENAACPR